MNKILDNHLLCFWAILSFEINPVTQVFVTDMQVKIWKSFYAFKWIHIEINNLDQECKIVVWNCRFKFLSCIPVKFVSKTIEYIKN